MDDSDDLTISSGSFFIPEPTTYQELLTYLCGEVEELNEVEKGELPKQLITLLGSARQEPSLQQAQFIVYYFLQHYEIYKNSTLDCIATFLDTAFFRACKTLHDHNFIPDANDKNLTAILITRNISALTTVLELIATQDLLQAPLGQENFNFILQHKNLEKFCSALITEDIECLQHELIQSHFQWLALCSKPKYLIKIFSLLHKAQLINKHNCEVLSLEIDEDDLKKYAGLLSILYQNGLLNKNSGQDNFLKIMEHTKPTSLYYALNALRNNSLEIPQLILNLFFTSSYPLRLSQAIQILAGKSLYLKISFQGKPLEAYLAQHPNPEKLAQAFGILYKSNEAITPKFISDNFHAIRKSSDPCYVTYNLYLINRLGILDDNYRNEIAQHPHAQDLFSVLDIITRRRMLTSSSLQRSQQLITQLLKHAKTECLAWCLTFFYTETLYKKPLLNTQTGNLVLQRLVQHPDLEYFVRILENLQCKQLLPSPAPTATNNADFWQIANHPHTKSLCRSIEILNGADLLTQDNLQVLLAHQRPVGLSKSLRSLDRLFTSPTYKYPELNKQQQEIFNELVNYPQIKHLSQILLKLKKSTLFNSMAGMANIKLVMNHPHRNSLLQLLSPLSNTHIFHRKNAQCFFDAIVKHPNPAYLGETLSHFLSQQRTINDAFILAMRQTGFIFNESQMSFTQNTQTMFYSKPRRSGFVVELTSSYGNIYS